LEQELDDIKASEFIIVETLESLDTTLDFLQQRVNKQVEKIHEIDFEQQKVDKPLEFKGLRTVETAKITLRTFFEFLLDLNVQKRDLEGKIEEIVTER